MPQNSMDNKACIWRGNMRAQLTSSLSEVFLARLKLARGDVSGASTMLAQTEQSVRQNNFLLRLREIADVQILILIRQGQAATAAQLAS